MTKGRPFRRFRRGLRLRPLAAAVCAAFTLSGGALAQQANTQPTLPAGTLPVLRPGRVQTGVSGIQYSSRAGADRRLDVFQNLPRAWIDWNSFNVAYGSMVKINQSPGDRIMNLIWDTAPSVIQGRVSADATMYLLNRNGIIFD